MSRYFLRENNNRIFLWRKIYLDIFAWYFLTIRSQAPKKPSRDRERSLYRQRVDLSAGHRKGLYEPTNLPISGQKSHVLHRYAVFK
jgi:hypothetical protein